MDREELIAIGDRERAAWKPTRVHCCTASGCLATGAAVAQTGLVTFVGLAEPHMARSLVQVTHGRLVLLAALVCGFAPILGYRIWKRLHHR